MPASHHIPALTRTFTSLPKCSAHPYSLLTGEGACPRCEHLQRAAIVQTVDDAREAARLQSLTRSAGGGKRQPMSEREACAIGSAA